MADTKCSQPDALLHQGYSHSLPVKNTQVLCRNVEGAKCLQLECLQNPIHDYTALFIVAIFDKALSLSLTQNKREGEESSRKSIKMHGQCTRVDHECEKRKDATKTSQNVSEV